MSSADFFAFSSQDSALVALEQLPGFARRPRDRRAFARGALLDLLHDAPYDVELLEEIGGSVVPLFWGREHGEDTLGREHG